MPLHFISSPTRFGLTVPVTAALLLGQALSPLAAHADVYHAVETGETLSSIAQRYHVGVDLIRAANNLQSVPEASTLPTMLLHIPDAGAKASDFKNLGLAAPNSNTQRVAVKPSHNGTGAISRSTRYTVAAGDTLESIAQNYTNRGQTVSVESIRDRNNLSGQPTAGQTLTIPLGAMSYSESTYRANASTNPGGVQVSDEVEWPVAKVLATGKPLYRAPKTGTAQRIASTKGTAAARRGPTNLSARGYFPSPNLDGGARVLGQEEEANNTVANRTPRPRVLTAPSAAKPTPKQNLARVAQVASSGARIRRLPTAEAVTLYSCPVKTELAVTKQNGAWSAILMSDRSTGWVPTRYLRFTGASVDITSQVAAASNGPTRSYDGRYTSRNPMVSQALTWIGTPYVYGGTSRRGIDCSALVQNSFSACGRRLPRTAAEQSKVGTAVDPSQLQPGDRLYFSASGSRVDHTGLYMGDGLFVHASGSGRRVMVSNLFERRNWNIFVGARR